MSWLGIDGLVKRFKGGVTALDGIDLALERGEFFTVVGPTNAGKSKLLKTIAGLERPEAGTIRLGRRDITNLEPRARQVSLLFQNIALFPTRTGYENIAGLLIHEHPKVWLYQWQQDGRWLEEPRTVYDDTWHAHCIYVTAELMHRRFDSRIVMAMAAAHQLGMLDAAMEGRRVVCNWIGFDRVAHFIKAAAVLAQVDPVDYGLLENRNGKQVLAPVPAEQWVTHLDDMNWPYTMGGAHLYTEPALKRIAEDDFGVKGDDLDGKPFNQLKNYVWSQLSQITHVARPPSPC